MSAVEERAASPEEIVTSPADGPGVDALGLRLLQVALALAGELWATRRRLELVEEELASAGVLDRQTLETRRSASGLASDDARRARDDFCRRVLGALVSDEATTASQGGPG